jgi:hypothetical protein
MSGGDLKRYICDVDRGSSKAVYWRYFAREPNDQPPPTPARAVHQSLDEHRTFRNHHTDHHRLRPGRSEDAFRAETRLARPTKGQVAW